MDEVAIPEIKKTPEQEWEEMNPLAKVAGVIGIIIFSIILLLILSQVKPV